VLGEARGDGGVDAERHRRRQVGCGGAPSHVSSPVLLAPGKASLLAKADLARTSSAHARTLPKKKPFGMAARANE
jgi:hypothetical protein